MGSGGPNRQDSPGVRPLDCDEHPPPRYSVSRPQLHCLGTGPQLQRTGEPRFRCLSPRGHGESVGRPRGRARPRPAGLAPGLPPAEPSWARSYSPALPRQDTPLPAVVHMCGHARRRGQAWLLPTALVPGRRREAAPPHRPPPQRGGPTGWEAQSPPGTRRRTGELTRDLPPPSIRWQSGGAAAPSPPASRSHSVPSAWQGRSAGVTRAAQ